MGILYILLCLFFFDVGYCAHLQNPTRTRDITVSYNGRVARILYSVVLLFSFFSLFYDIYNHGFGLQNLLNLDSFMEMSNEQSIERYSGDDEGGILTRLLGMNSYACVILGGMSYYLFSGRKKILSYLSLLPLILGGLAAGAKMGIITGTILWLIGLLLASQLLDEHLRISFRTIVFVVLGIIAFMVLLIVVMMFRIGAFDLDTLNIVLGKTISYTLGHLPAFDLWFSSHKESLSDLTVGGKTFFGITNSLGLLKREGGIFTNMIEVSGNGDRTNVFTIFRFFVEDFGTFGTLMYVFVMGMICKQVYNNFTQKRYIYLSTTLLCSIYFFISWSFVSSIFAYATYIALFFYLYFLLRLFLKIKRTSFS